MRKNQAERERKNHCPETIEERRCARVRDTRIAWRVYCVSKESKTKCVLWDSNPCDDLSLELESSALTTRPNTQLTETGLFLPLDTNRTRLVFSSANQAMQAFEIEGPEDASSSSTSSSVARPAAWKKHGKMALDTILYLNAAISLIAFLVFAIVLYLLWGTISEVRDDVRSGLQMYENEIRPWVNDMEQNDTVEKVNDLVDTAEDLKFAIGCILFPKTPACEAAALEAAAAAAAASASAGSSTTPSASSGTSPSSIRTAASGNAAASRDVSYVSTRRRSGGSGRMHMMTEDAYVPGMNTPIGVRGAGIPSDSYDGSGGAAALDMGSGMSMYGYV